MPTGEMKGITVRIDAELHAEIKAYLEAHDMKMPEFITLAAMNELHPKILEKERKGMENQKTLAFQVPEDFFYRIKDYLRRNNMTQKKFVIGLIEDELERDEALLQNDSEEAANEDETVDSETEQGEDDPDFTDDAVSEEEADDLTSEEAHEDFPDEDFDVSPEDFESDEDEDESEEAEEEDQEYSPEM